MSILRAGSTSDIEPLAALVAAAFEADPLMVWLLPDAATRQESTRRWWGPIVAGYITKERAIVTEDGTACLFWRRSSEPLPEAPGQPPIREVVQGLVPAERLDEVGVALAALPALRPVQPHVYVHVLAVHPDHQRRGHGARLLAALPAAAPGAEIFCLESTNPRNHAFYARNGFTADLQATLPGSTVTATSFRRFVR
jgi:GNAT superfamily N-acetyltransferase